MTVHSILNTKYLALLFLIFALPTGIRMALVTPMGQVSDEPSHIARADGLLYGEIIGSRRPGSGTLKTFTISGVWTDISIIVVELEELAPTMPANPLPPAISIAAHRITWTHKTGFNICPSTVDYLPVFYLPAAIGIQFGYLTGAFPIQALFDGRLAMLMSYSLAGTLALCLAAFGRPLIFALLMLPMSLALGASFNQDGQLIATMALGCALLTRDAKREPWTRWTAVSLIMLVTCSKPPYGILLFVALVPLSESGLLKRFGCVALFMIPPVLWFALMAHYSYAPWPRLVTHHPGPLWRGSHLVLLNKTDPVANLYLLLTQPAQIFLLPIQALWINWAAYGRQAIGALGWGPIALSSSQYAGWIIALIAATLGSRAAPGVLRLQPQDKFFFACLIIAGVFAMELSIYISWDDLGANVIDGLVGRYYLLFVPFMIFVLPCSGTANSRTQAVAAILTLPAIIMAAQDFFYLPNLLIAAFHMA